jgi:hypothetical protein
MLMDADVLRAEALRRELPATAAYLGIDITSGAGMADLTAVAIAQLAWRNGPVELWHRATPSRVADAEMMRANAATTRVVRGHLPDDVLARLPEVLPAVGDALADPDRCLPDGRTVRLLAAEAADFHLYADQVQAFFDRCGKLVERLGSFEVVGALACYAAAVCWNWWLAPGWPSIAGKIMDCLKGYPADQSSTAAGPLPSSELSLMGLHEKLLAGPDRLSTLEARYCRLASLGVRLPQDHGLSPRSRRVLPPAQRSLVGYLEFPTENFRRRLDQLYPSPFLWARQERHSIADGHDDAERSRQE